MKLFGTLVVVVLATSSFGCKFFEKKVPEDIVQKALSGSLKHMPNTASAMCGGTTKGFSSATVSIKTRGEKNTGVAHIKGKPLPSTDKDLAKSCEGDVEYAFSFTTKSYGSGKRRRTETTWFLDKVKLIAVQTDGVKLKNAAEEANDPEADDDDGDDDDKKK